MLVRCFTLRSSLLCYIRYLYFEDEIDVYDEVNIDICDKGKGIRKMKMKMKREEDRRREGLTFSYLLFVYLG